MRSHDVAREPLPENRFDVVHTRLVLMHLPDREKIISKLISTLKPGGYLLLEEFDSVSLRADPAANPAEFDFATIRAMYCLMVQRGVELRCGRLLDSWLRRLALKDVASEGRLFTWRSGSLGAQLLSLNIEQIRNDMIAAGMISNEQVEADLERLAEGDATFPSPTLWAAWGRKPRE